jgi:glyoxylase-like metal-dependent hydrolase (beta-lactamase superfamily II)
VAEPDYFGCNAGVAFVYEHLLRFDVPPAQQVGARLAAMGHPPAEVRTVALTHLHSDHAGGLSDFPNATFYLSRREAAQPPGGALPCRWPDGFAPVGVDYADGPVGAFGTSHALTRDGVVRLVPTPGHTHGHQSVIIVHEGRFVVLAGDASLTTDQVHRRAVAGICEDVRTARRTLAVLAEQLEQFPTTYLAAHDPLPLLTGAKDR